MKATTENVRWIPGDKMGIRAFDLKHPYHWGRAVVFYTAKTAGRAVLRKIVDNVLESP
jgi:hypothetical protein